MDNSINLYIEQRGPVNRYTPKSELWERFLLTNESAREMKAIMQWLESCAQKQDARRLGNGRGQSAGLEVVDHAGISSAMVREWPLNSATTFPSCAFVTVQS